MNRKQKFMSLEIEIDASYVLVKGTEAKD